MIKNNNYNECMMEKIVDFLIKAGEHCMKCEQLKLENDKNDKLDPDSDPHRCNIFVGHNLNKGQEYAFNKDIFRYYKISPESKGDVSR